MGVKANQQESHAVDDDDDDLDMIPSVDVESTATEAKIPLTELMMDWLDENSRFLFGGLIIFILSCTLIPSLVAFRSVAEDSNKSSSQTPKEPKSN